MPVAVADAAVASGRRAHLFCIAGELPAGADRHPHILIPLGSLGLLLRSLRKEGCREICIIGSIRRPDLGKLKLDTGALVSLPTILRLMIGGDDSVLTRIVHFFERKGFVVRGAHEIAPDLVVQSGVLGRIRPSRGQSQDIALGMRVAGDLGRLDVGQGAVVSRGHVIAVEAAEGTDRMLARCGELRQWGRHRRRRSGVFSKRAKPGQEMRIDMPVIGEETVRRAADAGLAGIAVRAGEVMIARRAETVALADQLGLFLAGVETEA